MYSLGLEQEVSRTFDDGTRAGFVLGSSMREWTGMYDYDADVLRLGGFVQRDLGSGFSGTLSGGWEQRDYDRLNIERDEVYVGATLGGPIRKDKAWFFAAVDYGVQENYQNYSSSGNWVDPIGLRLATGVRGIDLGPGTLAADIRVQHLESDLYAGPSWEILNYSLELSYVLSVNTLSIVPSIIYYYDDYDNGNDDDGFAFSVSLSKPL